MKVLNQDGQIIYEDFGELLFTHSGLSGPMILSASSHMRDFDNNKYTISIDLKPALDEETLDKRLISDFSKYAKNNFSNSLGDLFPSKMIPVILKKSSIPSQKKCSEITKEQRLELLNIIKNFKIEISNPRPIEEAIITSGGVDTTQINPSTMESKLVKGLYFAGEVIDVDAYTGGFNLQIAFSTGYVAGDNVK
jgi:predicted Rossmann fold flavoprotein